MSDMLSSATSGLLAFQRALDTTSHNIANVNTDGYSRQRVQLVTRDAQPTANGWLGNGTDVSTVQRLYSQYLIDDSRSTSSGLERLNSYSGNADALSNLFGDLQTGVNPALQKFVNAFQDVANSPTSIPARQVVLSQAQTLVNRLSTYDQRLQSLDKSVNSSLVDEANAINGLGKSIADLNDRIVRGLATTGQPPNDLLDQRDKLLDQLATHVNVSTTTQNDGSLIVSIGAGQSLVIGSTALTLTPIQDSYDPTRYNIAFTGAGPPVDVTSRLSGGKLGGLLDFRRDLLDPARNSIGRISVALTDIVNQQHRDGIDLNGNLGQDLLSIGGVGVQTRDTNTGTGGLNVTRSNVSALTEHDYVLLNTGSGYALTRADTGVAVTTSGAGTLASPLVADGLSIVVTGAPATGDSYLIRPTSGAIQGMKLLVTDPNNVAAAAPIATAVNANNVGNGTISAGEVIDVTNAQLQTPVTLQFLTSTTYSVNGAGSFTYTPGSNIDVNGWRVQINGAPGVNDTFTVGPNTNASGDNRNALKLAGALGTPIMDNGATSLTTAAGKLVGQLGVSANQAQVNRDAQQGLFDSAVNSRDSVSGVNLDEEASNLLRFQQAYQAAAQVIKIADSLFQSVLDAVRS